MSQKEANGEVINKTSNVYSKLSVARSKLNGLNPTGENKYSGYTYFELKDFLPKIMEVNAELSLCSFIDFNEQVATLTILDADNPSEKIIFNSPMKLAEVKGCQPIQNLGAVQTYQRRYLYMMAYEIAESDILNNVQGSDDEPDDINSLTTEWGKLRSELSELQIDFRSEEIKQRIANETGYASQEIDEDVAHVKKTNQVYKKLITEAKENKQPIDEKELKEEIVKLKNNCISYGLVIDSGKTHAWILKVANISTIDERNLDAKGLVALSKALKSILDKWNKQNG